MVKHQVQYLMCDGETSGTVPDNSGVLDNKTWSGDVMSVSVAARLKVCLLNTAVRKTRRKGCLL